MAKKKTKPAGAGKRSEPDGDDQIRIRMSRAFKAWVQSYADHRHLSMTDTVIQSLIQAARAEGFKDPPRR